MAERTFEKGIQADSGLMGRLVGEWQSAIIDLSYNPKRTVTVLGTIVRGYSWGYLLSEQQVALELGVSMQPPFNGEEDYNQRAAKRQKIADTISDLVSVSAVLEDRTEHPVAYRPSPTTLALLESSSDLTNPVAGSLS